MKKKNREREKNRMGRKKKSGTTTVISAVPDGVVLNEGTINKHIMEDTLEKKEVITNKEMICHKVDTGDIIKVKQMLDETVAGTFLDDLDVNTDEKELTENAKTLHFLEDHRLNNIKLVVMTVACAFAVVAQFAPLSFPASRPILGACCTVYFLLSAVLQLVMTFLDRDCILITKVMSLEQTTEELLKNNPSMITHGLRIRTSLPRFSEFYSVSIEFQGIINSPIVKKSWSVGKFFDVLGMFDEYGLMDEVQMLYAQFEVGNFDYPTQTGEGNKFRILSLIHI